jgi:hypothetical protein
MTEVVSLPQTIITNPEDKLENKYGCEQSDPKQEEREDENGANNPLSELVTTQAARIKELELSLADTRKLVHDREKLLEHLQWAPKVCTSRKTPTITHTPALKCRTNNSLRRITTSGRTQQSMTRMYVISKSTS